jgi:hypothetical protein
MVVRAINNLGGMKRIGKFPSIKLGRLVWWESPLESDYIHLLEPDSAVTFYKEQPLRIRYTFRGKEHFYTPDFLVQIGSKIKIVEVKPEKKAFDEKYQELFRIAAQACCQKGYEFVVVTDTMIRAQPKLDNIKVLWRYARTPLHPTHYILHCKEIFSRKSEIALGELFEIFITKQVSKRVIYGLLYWGLLEIDLLKPINGDSKICLLRTGLTPQEV